MPVGPHFGRWHMRLAQNPTADITAGRAHVRPFRLRVQMHLGALVLTWTTAAITPAGATSFLFTCPSSNSVFSRPDGWAVQLGGRDFLTIDKRSNSAVCIYDNDVRVTRSLGSQSCVLGAEGGELLDGTDAGLPGSDKVCIFKHGRRNLPQECYVLCP
jgi:hypothetical protein